LGAPGAGIPVKHISVAAETLFKIDLVYFFRQIPAVKKIHFADPPGKVGAFLSIAFIQYEGWHIA
jgi:hypothetical protein